MFPREILACLLLALTIFSRIKFGAGQIETSTPNPKYTKEEIEAAVAKYNMYTNFWAKILTKIGQEQFQKNPVLDQDELANFENHARLQLNKYDRRTKMLNSVFGNFYRPMQLG